MRKQNAKRWLALLTACVCLCGICAQPNRKSPVKAATIAELEAQRQSNNKKIEAYEAKLKQFSESEKKERVYQTTLTAKINVLEGNLSILDTEIDDIKENLAVLNEEIERMEQTISEQEGVIDVGLEEFKLRLRAMYVSGNDSLASALVGATDFYDLLSKYEMISCVARHDDELVTTLKDELESYHANLQFLEQQKAAAIAAQQEREVKQSEMKASMSDLQRSYADSEAEQKRLADEQKLLDANIDALEEKNRLADEAEREIRQEILRAQEEARKAAEKKAAEEAAKKAAEEAAQKAAEEAAKKAAQEAALQAAQQAQVNAMITAAQQAQATEQALQIQQPAATEQALQVPQAQEDLKNFEIPAPDNNASPAVKNVDDAAEAPAQNTGSAGEDNSHSSSEFGWPCPGHYYVSSTYGYRWGSLHKGIDIAQNKGADVVASRSGKVIRAVSSCTHNYGKSSNCCGNGYGNHVIIQHDDGTYSTLYGHMESIVVSVGDYVNKGDTIGYVGSTGYSTGFHLHFEIRRDGTATDPAEFLNY